MPDTLTMITCHDPGCTRAIPRTPHDVCVECNGHFCPDHLWSVYEHVGWICQDCAEELGFDVC